MTTLPISLPEDLKEFVERQVTSGGFQDASAYVLALLEDASVAQRRKEIEKVLLKRVEEVEHGEAKEMNAQDWQKLKSDPSWRAQLDKLLLEGIADIERGGAVEMTAEDWQEMRDEYLKRMTKGK